MANKISYEEFVERANTTHNNKYMYSKESFDNKDELGRVEIFCPIHNITFKQRFGYHMEKGLCPECAKELRRHKKTMTFDEFRNKAAQKHGNKYQYDKVDMFNRDENGKICITCPEHGDFKQTPQSHLSGSGCPYCATKQVHDRQKSTVTEFISKAIKIHGDRYDYNKVHYVNARTPVDIICRTHGKFSQVPNSHLNGNGCPVCGRLQANQSLLGNREDFITKAKSVHGDKYDYSKVEYVNAHTNVIITCPKHGDFKVTPNNHLKGECCPKCFKFHSHIEDEITEFITSVYKGEIIQNCRDILNKKEIDIFIPQLGIGIEVDGIIWHSEKFNSDKNKHLAKTEECENMGIQLIHIFEDEWNVRKDICKSRIKSLLMSSDRKIFARKCQIATIDSITASDFLNNNHVQGNVSSKYKYGLLYEGELVALMTFGSLRKNLGQNSKDGSYEMLRFCNKINTNVIGGASRLLRHFIKEHNPKEIISYADRRWSTGRLYEKLGFQFIKDTPPNYFYVTGYNIRENRFKYRKDVLVSKYGCPPEKSEHEFCLEQGWYRIYDCGSKKYQLIIN